MDVSISPLESLITSFFRRAAERRKRSALSYLSIFFWTETESGTMLVIPESFCVGVEETISAFLRIEPELEIFGFTKFETRFEDSIPIEFWDLLTMLFFASICFLATDNSAEKRKSEYTGHGKQSTLWLKAQP